MLGRCLVQSPFLVPRPESGHGLPAPPPPPPCSPALLVAFSASLFCLLSHILSFSLSLVLGSAPCGWLSPLPCPSSEAGEGCEGALSPPSA